MNKIKYIILSIVSLFIFSSCEDVIVLDLDYTQPKVVIEAYVNAGTNEAHVILSQSNGFYDTSEPQYLKGAKIILENQNGENYNLLEVSNGQYFADNITFQSQDTFNITVNYNDVEYVASSEVPSEVEIDSIKVNITEPPFGNQDAFAHLTAIWIDPGEHTNYYRVRPYQNDTLLTQVYNLENDELNNGKEFNSGIRERFLLGNEIKIELLSVDENYYDYFVHISEVVGNGFNSSSPYNPKGNFNNNALGYFGIYYSTFKTIQL